jgi:type VI secretion system secreted protein Hcp
MFTKRVTAVAMSLSVVLSAASAGAAFHSYASFKGKKQGQVKGEAEKADTKSDTTISIVRFEIEAPRDVHTGLATGRRQHTPLAITREVDTASPRLMQALANNEVFASFVLAQEEPGVPGGTITESLTNAHITAITPLVPDAQHPELDKTHKYETIALAFDRVDVTHAPSGKTESFPY